MEWSWRVGEGLGNRQGLWILQYISCQMHSPADQILFHLKTRGPSPTLGVAERLGVSRQAARQHLERLAAEGLDRLVARRETATAEGYARALSDDAGLEARLARLAALREAEGYMAEWRREADGSYLLTENHCPICAAAAACQGFCRSELELFQSLLAPARVDRTEHILADARRCAYRVTP